ncbi:hypothetical protein MVEG_12228 [Podila verticillata NRRL 6337]|uniref:Uncharacterized protein n=1 Tax=Podila verticillata NRRL 6337 TaxID=1069443 RepID=A0A086TIW7_9FUNG|nr:hypothetical protein MVEG_12228 [Podila verticillata NRRL 6337]
MSINETPPSPTQATTTTTTKKTTRVVVRKPNLDDKNNAIRNIDAKIDEIRPRLISTSCPTTSNQNVTLRQTVFCVHIIRLKERSSQALGELRDQQNENKKGKQAKVDKLNTLNNTLKKKIADLKVLQDKLPFKTTKAVEAQISKLEKQVEKGSLKLIEEKMILSEISILKISKKSVDTAQALQAAIDADKAEIVALKDTLDDDDARKLSAEYNKAQAALDEISKAKDEVWKKRNELFDERTRLQRELDAEFQRKKTINDEYYATVREHTKFLQDEQVRKREEIQTRKQQELEEKRRAIAREERELVEIPAFEAEITTCGHHSKCAQWCDADKKSEKVEDVYHVGAKFKKGKGSKEKKNETSSLKLPLSFELKIVVPTSPADLGKTLDALAEKRDHYRANQAKVTAENKHKTEERIAKLTLADVESTEAIIHRTEVAHMIEAAVYKSLVA